nr:hypothetical protein [Tanacetum cinerariifolium]
MMMSSSSSVGDPPLRRLILLRHADSSWDDRSLKDHDRPVSKAGENDAKQVSHKLHHLGWIPQLILSSDATRTRQTLQIMQHHVRAFLEAEVHFISSFYSVAAMDGQTAHHLQRAISKYSTDDILTLMCMGHNKGWEEAASTLSGASIELKTCNAALLEAAGKSWEEAFLLAGHGGWKLQQLSVYSREVVGGVTKLPKWDAPEPVPAARVEGGNAELFGEDVRPRPPGARANNNNNDFSLSWKKMIDQFINFVIRPPRASYNPDEYLWDKQFSLAGRAFIRQDLHLINTRGHLLQCSHYMPSPSPPPHPLPCVVYCHGNSGCRADANDAALILLPSNITLFTLDFSGSGLSDGDYVSLGSHESLDLKVVVDYLRDNHLVSSIGLWGRSMGAVT